MSRLVINDENKLSHIEPEVYGHFSEHLGRCIYEGIYVGEDSDIDNVNGMRTDVVEALKKLRVPVLRWPGGCFADEYHWKDGIGSKSERKKMVNTHWGGVTEDNSFGTHEYMELCRQLGCKTYINGNLGSGTVQEMSEWVEYMTRSSGSPMAELRAANGHPDPWQIDYFGVGNENWGCGGNMLPDYYANLYRRYQTYVRDYDPDHRIKKVCCGANDDEYYWTSEVLGRAFAHVRPEDHGHMDMLSLHYYTIPDGWDDRGLATEFDTRKWYVTMKGAYRMDELVTKHGEIMDSFDPDKHIGLCVDEWGTWFDAEPGTNPGFLYQQNTIRDALVAGITLNIFNKHSDRVKMANLAQLVNVLQAVILTDGEKMIKTPTYHVMHMYRYHQNADLIGSVLTGADEVGEDGVIVPKVTESVSMDKEGIITITLANLSATDKEKIDIQFIGKGYDVREAYVVTDDDIHAHNTFDKPDRVIEQEFRDYAVSNSQIDLTLPAASVVVLRVGR